jgi:hypothetical protein
MVSVTGPAAAALSAEIVNTLLVVAGLVANWATISGDELATVSVTAPVNPPASAIFMVSVVLAPAATLTLVDAGVSVKPGVWDTPPLTVTGMVVVTVVPPEVPVIVRVKDPFAAVVPAVSVNTLVPVVGLGANAAVTPVGGVEADSITSHQTGWSSNDNVYSYATSIGGPWSTPVDIAVPGTDTYKSQTTYVVPVTGSSGTTYMYMGDRWNSGDITGSTYVWLPLEISGSTITMPWENSWNLDITTGTWTINTVTPTTGANDPLISQNSGMCLSAVNTTAGTQLEQITCNSATLQKWDITTGASGFYMTNADTGMVADDSGNSKTAGGAVIDFAKNGGSNQRWIFVPNGEGYFNIINVFSGLCLDVENASTSSGALIDQYTCNSGANQNWKQ